MTTVTSYREWLEALDGPEGEPIMMGYATERLPMVEVPSARITQQLPTITNAQAMRARAAYHGQRTQPTRGQMLSGIGQAIGLGATIGAIVALFVAMAILTHQGAAPEPQPTTMLGVPLVGELPSTTASTVAGSSTTASTHTIRQAVAPSPTVLATDVGTITTKGVAPTSTVGVVPTTTGVPSTTMGDGSVATPTTTVAGTEVDTTTTTVRQPDTVPSTVPPSVPPTQPVTIVTQ